MASSPWTQLSSITFFSALLCVSGCFDPTAVDLTATTGTGADDDGASGPEPTVGSADDGQTGPDVDDTGDPTGDGSGDPTGDASDTTDGPPVACESDDDCTDPDPCVIGMCGAAGVCEATTVDPDDDDPCTLDACDPATHEPINTLDIDDDDPCTFDTCDPAAGPQHVPEVVLFEDTFENGMNGWTTPPGVPGGPPSAWQIGPAVPSGVTVNVGAYLHDPAEDHSDGDDNMLAGVA